ncbi:MAG: adenylate/guanylate cyclase domain-containing protein, partial [Pseudomonadota bacterium]
MADISGSTKLYDTAGNTTALSRISRMLDRMRALVEREGGHCVKSQGDDVLSYFDQPEEAFAAAWHMINEPWSDGLSVHAGLYMGSFLNHENDIYGDVVNMAARLASLAKSGEIMVGGASFDLLAPDTRARLLPIGDIMLKGKAEPTRVYCGSVIDLHQQTVVTVRSTPNPAPMAQGAAVTFGGRIWHITEGEALTVGRSSENDIVIPEAWVSRKHAQMTIRAQQLEYADHSSVGSIVQLADGEQITVHRRATLLSGSGVIFAGNRADPESKSAISFAINNLAV